VPVFRDVCYLSTFSLIQTKFHRGKFASLQLPLGKEIELPEGQALILGRGENRIFIQISLDTMFI
jgi:hypothetical protein